MSRNSPIQKLIAIIALSSNFLSLSVHAAADPNPHAEKGKAQGTLDATAEAKTRVRLLVADRTNGARVQGFNQGFNARRDQIIALEFERGRKIGEREGIDPGRIEGRAQGTNDGHVRGLQQGAEEGYRRADNDARAAGSARGSQEGRAQADATDSAARGTTAGKAQGDAEARQAAQTNEYKPAYDQYMRDRMAERVDSESAIDLKKGVYPTLDRVSNATAHYFTQMIPNTSTSGTTARVDAALKAFLTDPTVPAVKPTEGPAKALEHCKGQTEHQACVDTFVAAYNEAFTAAFGPSYIASYNEQWPLEFAAGRNEGTAAADKDPRVVKDARRARQDGHRRGYDESYRNAYDYAYRSVFEVARRQAYDDAFAQKYQEVYATLEVRYADQSRAAEFERRKQELYNFAFEAARKAEYTAKYPGYAQQVQAQARKDAARDLELNPVRLVSKLAVMETIQDGILEPAENLSLAFDLRNLSVNSIAAKDLDIRAVALDANGTAIPESVAILTRALAPKSLTHVRGAFTIQLGESALTRAKSIQLVVAFQGRKFATETVAIQAQTLTRIEFAEKLETRLGYPGTLKLRITNQSTKVLPEESLLVLDTKIEGITFSKVQEKIGTLAAGESTTVTFPFMNDSYGWSKPIQFVASIHSKSGRLTGMLNESRELPALKDYEVYVVKGDLDGIRKSGRTRVRVRVKNVGTRVGAAAVTVECSIQADRGTFEFIKGQKVVYSQIRPGNYGEQKVTVKSNQRGGSGKFVMKIYEGDKFLGYFEEQF